MGEDFHMVGQLALTGHLTVGLFPKLGYLDSIWRLLQGGPDFLDRANAKSDSSYKVWDVNWGSVFTRANGSAASMITDYALRKHKVAISMPEEVVTESHQPSATPSVGANSGSNPENRGSHKAPFRRYQELHIICISRKSRPKTLKAALLHLIFSRFGRIIYHLALVGLVIILSLIGAFGSSVIIANGLLSKMVCRLLRAERPSGYLENNENHGACMLSAVHENATTWHLYMGDRGVIDWLLNKTMLSTPPANRFLMVYFRFAHISQLLAMTFVAAQKGADGISLVVLLLINYCFQYSYGGHTKARTWLDAENISVDAHTFRFSGRTPMIGAIHLISEARAAVWMDTLIVPCPRVKVWLKHLSGNTGKVHRKDSTVENLSSSDRSWVTLNSQLTIKAAKLIRQKLQQGKATESLCIKDEK